MFHKPFRVKTQTAIKGSDRKKLRAELGRQFPHVGDDQLMFIVPNKEEMYNMKIFTHSGQTITVYLLHRNPVFFEVEKTIYPTVYALWSYPELMPVFATWPPVLSRLIGGADLMLPGVVVDGPVTPYSLGDLKKRAPCAIKVVGNKCPVAVGKTALSTADMYGAGMKGKGVIVLHSYQDHLWAHGDKMQLPLIEDTEFLNVIARGEALEDDDDDDDDGDGGHGEETEETSTDEAEKCAVSSDCTESNAHSEESSTGPRDMCSDARVCDDGSMTAATEAMNSLHVSDSNNPSAISVGAAEAGPSDADAEEGAEDDADEEEEEEEDEDDYGRSPQERMDELLRWCFMCALKVKLKKADLPILTSTFYRTHLLACCPSGKYVDVKKSSHKKLGKFLQVMKKEGIIGVKELSKGVESITSVDRDHLDFRNFKVNIDELPQVECGAVAGADDSEDTFTYKPPQVRDMYLVSGNVKAFFEPAGYRKGSALSAQDLRKVLTDYVKSNELQNPARRGMVTLDPLLSDLLLNKGEYIEHLTWEDIFPRCASKLSPAYEIAFPGQQPTLKKGKLDPIVFNIATRSGNKKVTLIENLEVYGIDPNELAHRVQVGVACSTSVSPLPGKNRGMQILIQGNQINYVAQLLVDKYQLQRKWFQGLDKAPKSGKKRR